MRNQAKTNDSGQFTTGFTLGLLAGAAGFFLFGTKRGREVRHRLQAEWERARQDRTLWSVGTGTPSSTRSLPGKARETQNEPPETLKDLIDFGKEQLFKFLDSLPSQDQDSGSTKKSARSKNSPASAVKKRLFFRGV